MYGITAPAPIPYDENNLATWNRDQLERALRATRGSEYIAIEQRNALSEALVAVQEFVNALSDGVELDKAWDHLALLFVNEVLTDPRRVQEDLDYEVTVTLNVRVSAEYRPSERDEVVADILNRLERTDFAPEVNIYDGDDLPGSWGTVAYEISEVDVTDPSQDVSTHE